MNQANSRQTLPLGSNVDHFRIEEVLGIGGFGVTYRAFDERLERVVALKEYFPADLAKRAENDLNLTPKEKKLNEDFDYGLKRFLDEARVLARFDHPNIVRVLSFLQAFGTAYLVMEYLEGQTLSRSLKQNVNIDETTIRRLILPILFGLKAVHQRDFLHRDIKPSNILVRKDGSPVLIDFGSARLALGQKAEQMTAIATPGYAPIEQYSTSERQGPWTDIYAIGATCFHCASGTPPPAAPDRLMARYDNKDDPLKSSWNFLTQQGYSERFVRSMRWMMTLSPAKRPQSIEALMAHFSPKAPPKSQESTVALTRNLSAKIQRLSDKSKAALSDEVIDTLEAEISERIGPLARPLVRQAARQANSLDELKKLLDDYLPSPVAQEMVSTPLSQPSSPATGLVLEEETSHTLEHLMSEHIGPIARILVKKALLEANDADHLTKILAEEIPDPQERRQVINKIKEKIA